MGETLRNLTPLALLGLCALVWFESCIPGANSIEQNLGETAVLRFVVGLLCLFVLVLMAERQHLNTVFQQMLGRLQQLQSRAGGGGGEAVPEASGPDEAKLKNDAMAILVAALDADDPSVRQNAVTNLERLTGQKFGTDAARWRQYMAERATEG